MNALQIIESSPFGEINPSEVAYIWKGEIFRQEYGEYTQHYTIAVRNPEWQKSDSGYLLCRVDKKEALDRRKLSTFMRKSGVCVTGIPKLNDLLKLLREKPTDDLLKSRKRQGSWITIETRNSGKVEINTSDVIELDDRTIATSSPYTYRYHGRDPTGEYSHNIYAITRETAMMLSKLSGVPFLECLEGENPASETDESESQTIPPAEAEREIPATQAQEALPTPAPDPQRGKARPKSLLDWLEITGQF